MSRVLIVEDHPLVRKGLAQALARVPGVQEVQEVGDAESALLLLGQQEQFDLVVVDVVLSGIGGLTLVGILRKRFPWMRVVVVSGQENGEMVERLYGGKTVAFVSKARPVVELVDTVSRILAEPVPPAPPVRDSKYYQDAYGLSNAQARVLDWLAKGKSNKEIATVLGLTEGTVKVHVTTIFKLLGVSNRNQALLLVTKEGGQQG